ncbi:mechanosensitive ion channel domain-containing protein [Zoogloea sp.]|jgi:small-conductance mechanosensitive channel|uniref:mechanosensitive ion channel family protein n=1 Tax=Zoogloea sp. TaxID=49181 RepID=UPI002BBA200F|nr:mechanosensitive ion channel domain-containing protein [Zoogloea sp.]HOY00118.1 mechanosensitive ion channel [Zoogloea sp.]HPI61330.1 mechanosensitive ion channel [Zoogloea sp.]
MEENQIAQLLIEVWDDVQKPAIFWQIGVLAVCLLIAGLISRQVKEMLRRRASAEPGSVRDVGEEGLRRVVFPLSALLLVVLARVTLDKWHHVNLLKLAIPLLLAMAVIRLTVHALKRAFPRAGWLASFERFFAFSAWAAVALHIIGVLPAVIDGLEQISFPVGKSSVNLWMLLQGGLTVMLTVLIALWLAGTVEARLMHTEGLDANLKLVFARLSKALLIILAVSIGLPLVGIDLTALSVFGGALGVGLGLGMQKIAANYVSGFILLLDRSIRMGNLISVGNERGVVSQITTRYTVLKGMSGIESIVPNETLVGAVVQNETFTDPKVRIALPVQVSYATDLEKAMGILVEAAGNQARVMTDPAPGAFVEAFADSGINLQLGFWIRDPAEGTLGIRSAINLEIWRRFKEEGIEIPFPQREVRVLNPAPSVPIEAQGGAVSIQPQ